MLTLSKELCTKNISELDTFHQFTCDLTGFLGQIGWFYSGTTLLNIMRHGQLPPWESSLNIVLCSEKVLDKAEEILKKADFKINRENFSISREGHYAYYTILKFDNSVKKFRDIDFDYSMGEIFPIKWGKILSPRLDQELFVPIPNCAEKYLDLMFPMWKSIIYIKGKKYVEDNNFCLIKATDQ